MRRGPITLGAAGLLAAAACTAAAQDAKARPRARGAAAAPPACVVASTSVSLPRRVAESSGVAVSRRHPGVYWTHNDRGGEALLFAVDSLGRLLDEIQVRGAEAHDWEDIALGPCPAGECLYVADTGNNREKRGEVTLYRVAEPSPDAREARAESFPMRFPGHPRDTEALFVLPSGEVYFVSKGESGPVELFRYPLPLRPGRRVVLERVRRIAPEPRRRGDKVTAADATSDGRWVAVRSYDALSIYRTADLLGSGGAALEFDLRPLGEAQGEGVGFGPNGEVVLTSEAGGRDRATLARLRCRLPAG